MSWLAGDMWQIPMASWRRRQPTLLTMTGKYGIPALVRFAGVNSKLPDVFQNQVVSLKFKGGDWVEGHIRSRQWIVQRILFHPIPIVRFIRLYLNSVSRTVNFKFGRCEMESANYAYGYIQEYCHSSFSHKTLYNSSKYLGKPSRDFSASHRSYSKYLNCAANGFPSIKDLSEPRLTWVFVLLIWVIHHGATLPSVPKTH